MTVMINLLPELEQRVRQHAARSGQELSALVLRAVEESIARGGTFEEIRAPFARALEAERSVAGGLP